MPSLSVCSVESCKEAWEGASKPLTGGVYVHIYTYTNRNALYIERDSTVTEHSKLKMDPRLNT